MDAPPQASAVFGVYAWSRDYERGPAGEMIAWRRYYLAALGPTGRPKSGWPYSTPVPASDPTFGQDGHVYLVTGYVDRWPTEVAPAQRVHLVVALDPDGKARPGWPYALPASVHPQSALDAPGEISVGEPPVVGADGTIFVSAARGELHSGDDLVYALTPDGRLKPGWPFATTLSNAFLAEELVGVAGATPGTLPPVPGAGGIVYVATRVGGMPSAHDEVVALGPDGTVQPGWPFALPARAGVQAVICARPDGAESFRTNACWIRVGLDGIIQFTADLVGVVCLRPDGEPARCPR